MSSQALRLLLVLVVMVSLAQGRILTRAIEAQKTLVEREEQMLDQAKQRVQQKAQDAYDASRDAVTNVADQLRYVVMYPWRMANEALERPKLYAKYLISKVPVPLLGSEVTTPPPATTVDLAEETEVVEPTTSESNRLPSLVSNLQSFFTGEPTPPEGDERKPNPYIEVIEIKYEGPKLVTSQSSEQVPPLPMAATGDQPNEENVLS